MAESNNFLNDAGLSFIDIKYNFINYLKSQSEFSDYNLEGSNLTVLLDILSYNTAQQGFYNTMVANEMFIDRASKRSSVVSLAKLLGYTPNTKRSAKAKVLVTVSAEDVPASKVLPRGSSFSGSVNNNTYSFTNTEAYSFYPYTFNTTTDPDSSESGEILSYACGPLELKQGILNTISYNVESYDQSFLITDINADKDSIRVVVLNSVTDITGINIPWQLSNDLVSLNENSKVFFIEENNFGQLVLKFGDGVIGKKLSVGNVVIIEYISTAGSDANGIGKSDTTTKRSFNYDGEENYTVLTIEPSNSGYDRESSSSIKRNAVRNYTSRERAVTVKDYEGAILAAFNNNAAVRCWGGEENDPPYYGKVFASVRPIGSTIISSEEKENLVKNILKEKNIVGIDITVVDPEVLYIILDADVYYEKDLTNDSSTSIRKKIKDSLVVYFRNNLIEFGDSIFAQDIETTIKQSSNAIKAADAKITLMKKVIPTLNVSEKTTIDFQNKLYHPYNGYPSILTSSTFYISANSGSHFIEDDGNGKLILKKKINGVISTVNAKYGTIDYNTGKLSIPAFKVFSFAQGKTSVDFKVIPNNSNIFTKQNSILEFDSLDNNSLSINMNEVKTQRVAGGSGTVITNQ
jgi:hypothetical protein